MGMLRVQYYLYIKLKGNFLQENSPENDVLVKQFQNDFQKSWEYDV